jgi:hypothetical protein
MVMVSQHAEGGPGCVCMAAVGAAEQEVWVMSTTIMYQVHSAESTHWNVSCLTAVVLVVVRVRTGRWWRRALHRLFLSRDATVFRFFTSSHLSLVPSHSIERSGQAERSTRRTL